MVFFVGHSAEIDGTPYLVPIEGEMDNAASLIPLSWVLQQLARCPARQKVLVLDAHRFNPNQGLERPASGEMGPKFDEVIKNPPAGVQVWSACVAGQKSYASDTHPVGLFLESLRVGLDPTDQIARTNTKGVLDEKIGRRK